MQVNMVGSRGKGSRSKPKGLAPTESTVSFDEPASGLLDGEEGKNDSPNTKVIPLEEEQMEEIKSGSVVGDEHEDQGQNTLEGANVEKDIVTEINEMTVDKTEIVCVQGGAKEDMKEEDVKGNMKAESDGGSAAVNVSVEHIEKRTNEEKTEEDEVLVKTGPDSSDAVDERKSSEVTTEGLPASNGGLDSSDLGMMENMTENLENPDDPSKLNSEEPIETLSRGEEHIKENSSIANEVKEVTRQLNRPKRKIVKKKVLRKKVVRRQDAVSQEEAPSPSEKNDPIVEACKVDTNEDLNTEEKTSNVNNASDKADAIEHSNGEEKVGVKPSVKVNHKGSRIKKKMAPEGHSGAVIAKDGQNLPPRNDEPNKCVDDEEKEELKPPVKVNKKRIRIKKKKAPQGHLGAVTAKDDQKLPSGNDESGTNDHTEIIEPDVKIEGVEKSGDRMSVSNKSKKKKSVDKGSVEVVPEDSENPKPSDEGKRKRIDSMGMIFMCSSETKKDCYEYQVLGLPASKKDMVLKIYKGMRIFLFDVDLRMMYGIYKAAGPGGYNIEPKAFKSQYPSQVRFTILEDCVPLAEERFKKVIKDNYYTKNKFNCQLNSAQVRNLCKLFHETRKTADSTKVSGKKKRKAAATTSSAQRNKKQKRVEDNRRGATSSSLEQERNRRRSHKDVRRAPVVIDDRYYGRPVYKRETYVPSVAPVTIYQPVTTVSPRSRTYSYERTLGTDPYRRDEILDRDRYRREIPVLERDSYRREIPVIDDDHYRRNPVLVHDVYRRESVIDHRDLAPSSSRESRGLVERSHHEPYASYREIREPRFYSRPAAYSTSTKREHYDYPSSGHYAAEYHRPAEDRPPPPLYRRY